MWSLGQPNVSGEILEVERRESVKGSKGVTESVERE